LAGVCSIMRKIIKLAILINSILVCAFCQTVLAGSVDGIRFWQDPEKTRLVFDTSSEVDYKLFSLSNPERLVIDIKSAKLTVDTAKVPLPPSLVNRIRSSQQDDKIRIVIDLKHAVDTKHFKLKPFQNFNHRLVVDIRDKSSAKTATKIIKKDADSNNRDIIIAIDAGHGGEDPGASGPTKTREKNITLAVAKKLAEKINAEKGMKAVLTRTADYYVDHRKRTDIARENQADLFISLHADAFTDRRVRGAGVYIISTEGASSEMGRWLAESENQSDLAGGVEISNKEPMLAQVILDLSTHYSVGASINAANSVYKELKNTVPKMHGKSVQRAGFLVLKMPDIPGMLVEMAFISNPTEEKRLKSSKEQTKIANAVFKGVKSYFLNHPPDNSYYASLAKSRSYKVKKGDTLSDIASTYGVSVKQLKTHNNLKSNGLRIGQTLIIPKA